jgi:hypothetical protein
MYRDFLRRHTKNSKWNGNGNIETVSLYTWRNWIW